MDVQEALKRYTSREIMGVMQS